MSSILSPIDPNRFQVELAYYGDGVAGNLFSFSAFSANATVIINLGCKLLTTIAAANRLIYLSLVRDGSWSYFAPSPDVQIANRGIIYSFAPYNNSPAITDSPFVPCSVPPDMLMLKDDILSIAVLNMDVGDRITDITCYWKIFPTG